MTTTPKSDLEKAAAGLTFAEPTLRQQHPHTFRTRERIRAFLHPDGKRIHIVSTQEEEALLRQKLEQLHKQDDFDIYISGTPEHLDALRKAQTHHEERQEVLRTQHGNVYEQFENVRAELDALSSELDRVTTHGVSLEAHFSKYGYGAHIRSYDEEESPSASGTATPRSSNIERKESEAEKGYATTLKLFKRPVVRQYFHKGILWRGSNSEQVMSFELFVDLLYVGIIAVNGDATAERPGGVEVLRFVVTFTLSWKIWNGGFPVCSSLLRRDG